MKTKIPRRLPKPAMMNAVEREYLRNLLKYQRTFQKLLRDGLSELVPTLKETAAKELPEVRTDSIRMDANIEKGISALFESVQTSLQSIFPDSMLQRWARAMVGHVNKTVKKNTQKVAEAADLEIEPLMRDKELTPYFQNVIDENVGLIRSIYTSQVPSFKNALVSMITQDLPHSEISSLIQKQFNMSKNKANLIARDQIGKLNGALAKYRQQSLGAKTYIWRGMNDARERKDHKRLNGKRFSWDKPPIVDTSTGRRGHPGEDFQCRCYPEIVLDDILA